MLGLDLDGAVGDGVIQVSTDLLDIDAEVEPVRAVALMNVLMSLGDGRDAVGCVPDAASAPDRPHRRPGG